MTIALCIVFFFSGASALIFEILWFQLAGLTFGSSVWATAIVLCSFMAGLALGNGLAAFKGKHIQSPIFFYAGLEMIIAISGYGLVVLFPKLTVWLAPLFQVFLGHAMALNVVRSVFAFFLMIIPATAMGATLPVLVKALYSRDANFGRVLGVLYGWNTVGATAGVLMAEILLLKWFGIKGTGLVAVVFNVIAICLSVALGQRIKKRKVIFAETTVVHLGRCFTPKVIRLLLASLLSGMTLLALEVIWFRFIILFFSSHSLNFAIMLAMVLSGISIGGLFASRWFKSQPDAQAFLTTILFASGILIIATYIACIHVLDLFIERSPEFRILVTSIFLIFPISLISGMVFTMLGKALHRQIQSETTATGLLTLANTTGGVIGSLLALVLIPSIGIENSFFLFALIYGAIAFLLHDAELFKLLVRKPAYQHVMVGLYLAFVLYFPFNPMENDYLNKSAQNYIRKGQVRLAYKEGLAETVQYLQSNLLGQPYFQTLMTNNFAMSGTYVFNKRYMKLFTYWPVAVHPDPKDALLICFGCGITAKALTDTQSLTNIDIVDISRDVIEMSQYVFKDPKENPIHDPRVSIHIEDGRFFLMTSERKYDVITAEPPPPASKGVGNLYSQEYFRLIYDRLADNGIVTYWLPGHLLTVPEGKSILKGFCNVFTDCSLWIGGGFNFMMVGTKNFQGPVLENQFKHQWQNDRVGPEMRALGFESPEQFGSLFVADGRRLLEWVADAAPLTDNFPHRVSYQSYKIRKEMKGYRDIMDPQASEANFMTSAYIAGLWPEGLRHQTKKFFKVRDTINEIDIDRRLSHTHLLEILHRTIHEPMLQNYILRACLSDAYAQKIISKSIPGNSVGGHNDLRYFFGMAALAAQKHDYLSAARYLGMADEQLQTDLTIQGRYLIARYRIYFLYIANQGKSAAKVGRQYIDLHPEGKTQRRAQMRAFWSWMVPAVQASSSPR